MKEVELKGIAEKAGRAAAAEAVYLFGSRATGLAREDSDFDFALILGDNVDPWRATFEAQRALWPREFSVDIAPISRQAWLTSKDFFVESIRRDGRLLYSSDGDT
jgi:predicted nucleotidyltransferase